jgi:hypothetical protein
VPSPSGWTQTLTPRNVRSIWSLECLCHGCTSDGRAQAQATKSLA